MKKSMIKVMALSLVMVIMVGVLASCGGLSGTYESKVEAFGQSVSSSYKFSGSKVEASTKTTILGNINTETVKGTYKISDDGTEITFDFEEEKGAFHDGTFTFEKGEDYVKIAGVQYTKK